MIPIGRHGNELLKVKEMELDPVYIGMGTHGGLSDLGWWFSWTVVQCARRGCHRDRSLGKTSGDVVRIIEK